MNMGNVSFLLGVFLIVYGLLKQKFGRINCFEMNIEIVYQNSLRLRSQKNSESLAISEFAFWHDKCFLFANNCADRHYYV